MRVNRLVIAGLVSCWLAAPAIAGAQTGSNGAIAGSVKDTTGAVLPGVSVEASSPSLIEKSRTVVTDAAGNYKIVELRPGTYTVTFSLAGFNAVKRDGLELTTGFTATVNAEMKVGAVEETITVQAASPVVDVQNVRMQAEISDATMRELPVAQSLNSYAALTLGAVLSVASHQDVGGNKGDSGGNGYFIVHNSGRIYDSVSLLDGMEYSQAGGGGGVASRTNFVNTLAVQETTITTSGNSAEFGYGGAVINTVPKDGGNTFKGLFLARGSSSSMQGTNLTADLIGRGIPQQANIAYLYDAGGAIGGPIAKDKLWFYAAVRYWGMKTYLAGNFFNATLHSFVYTPDSSQQAYIRKPDQDYTLRLAWQATPKQKVTVWQSYEENCDCYQTADSGTNAPEASVTIPHQPEIVTQATWSYPRTNRLLFEAGASSLYEISRPYAPDPRSLPTDIPLTELSTGLNYNARAQLLTFITDYNPVGNNVSEANQRFSVSYITGSHAFKTGFTVMEAWSQYGGVENDIPGIGPVRYNLLRGAPSSIVEFASPNVMRFRSRPLLGIYAQDQWTTKRLTLNLGVRYDHAHEFALAQDLPAIPAFGIPARSFPEVDNIPNWHDINPRVGAAYDVFGNGKTAIKTSFGRYPLAEKVNIGAANTPTARIATQVTRTWADANGNYYPDCNLAIPTANGECGTISDRNFGNLTSSTSYDSSVLNGWGVRPYFWQATAQLQQELLPRLALNVGYFNVWYGNFLVTNNTAVGATDFSPFCVTAPTDARLGQSSGQQICGNFDVNPSKFGQVLNVVQFASNFGNQYEHFNGIDVSVSSRFGAGGSIQGGVSTGQTVTDSCGIVVNNPQISGVVTSGNVAPITAPRNTSFCHLVNPWSEQVQVKLAGVYPLPWWGIMAAANYQNLPGINYTSTLSYTNLQIAPSLGRNLAAGATAVASVQILPAFQQYEDRITQLDVRLSKVFRIGRSRLSADLDVYNLFNASPILAETTVFGASFLKPATILGARLFKIGGQFEF